MYKYFIYILLFLPLTISAQTKKKPEPKDISEILSFKDFQQIKKFILDKGEISIYSSKYSHTPSYRIEEDIMLYLNPIVQIPKKEELADSDIYNTLVIQMWNAEGDYPFMYTFIEENRELKKVFISPYYDTEETLSQRKEKIGKYIAKILEKIRK